MGRDRGQRAGVVLAACCALTACATPEPQIAQASNIQAIDDNFLPYRRYSTGILKADGAPLFAEGLQGRILSVQVDKMSGKRLTFVEVILGYPARTRRKFVEARSASTGLLQFQVNDHKASHCKKATSDCFYTETLSVILPEPALTAAGPGGYPIKLFALNGAPVLVEIPKPLIDALYVKADSGEQQVAAAQAPGPNATAAPAPAASVAQSR